MYQYALWTHLTTLVILAIVIVVADHYAYSWIRGHRETLDAKRLTLFHTLVSIGLVLMILSGAYMLYGQYEFLREQPLFLIKILFVGLLIANGTVIHRLMHIASKQTFSSTTGKQRTVLFASGIVSFVGWLGAFTMAKYLF